MRYVEPLHLVGIRSSQPARARMATEVQSPCMQPETRQPDLEIEYGARESPRSRRIVNRKPCVDEAWPTSTFVAGHLLATQYTLPCHPARVRNTQSQLSDFEQKWHAPPPLPIERCIIGRCPC
jgi:hypothetical protein